VPKIPGFKLQKMPKSKLTLGKAMKAPGRSHGKHGKLPTLVDYKRRVPEGGLQSSGLRKGVCVNGKQKVI
jgi:hypothetical protein